MFVVVYTQEKGLPTRKYIYVPISNKEEYFNYINKKNKNVNSKRKILIRKNQRGK